MSFITEGSAKIRLPQGVFYNPVQEFNRDVSIAVIKSYLYLHRNEHAEKSIKRNTNPIVYNGISILDALAASGLRSVRIALEIPFVSKVVANDLDIESSKLVSENASMNNVDELVSAYCEDAIILMHRCKTFSERFNVVDIDPYGSACTFLDSAVQCLHDGGLLCVTSTDMAVLCGTAAGTAFGKYGGMAIRMAAVHEQGLRLLLHAIQMAASRHGKVIEPLLSLSVDFYARVFVRVYSSPASVKRIASKLSIVYSCSGCQSYYLQPLGRLSEFKDSICCAIGPITERSCECCGSAFHVGGPLWSGPLHSVDFVNRVLQRLHAMKASTLPTPTDSTADGDTASAQKEPSDVLTYSPNLRTLPSEALFGTLDRMIGLLTVATEELPDSPFYFRTDLLSTTLRTTSPKITELRSAFLNAGYRISGSHAAVGAIKTNAPMHFIWDVMCSWKRRVDAAKRSTATDTEGSLLAPTSIRAPGDTTKRQISEEAHAVMRALLNRPHNSSIDFSLHPQADPPSRSKGLIRFPPNPQPNWGPKARARRGLWKDRPLNNLVASDAKKPKTDLTELQPATQ